jgi:hypothetical protein
MFENIWHVLVNVIIKWIIGTGVHMLSCTNIITVVRMLLKCFVYGGTDFVSVDADGIHCLPVCHQETTDNLRDYFDS